MATCDELAAYLSAAETAYHLLQLGGQEVKLKYGEKEIWYSPAKSRDLLAYIAMLRSQQAASGCAGITASRRRIIRPYFTDSGR